ncbi:Ras- protein Rab-22A [Tyrophagus putrescentiae]|nr:Ras- protein Rab-22A [Tyrophagus putrescentiae]
MQKQQQQQNSSASASGRLGNEFKICLLGETCVGKSSIVQRFVHNTFNSGNETIGASFMTKTLYLGGSSLKLNIWDTAGQERYKALTPMYYRGANICIVVYDVTCPNSFKAVQNWIKELRTYLSEQYLIAIAGNKCDLTKVVNSDDAKQYADSVGAFFIETSAKNSHNINELFISAINLHRNSFASKDKSGSSPSDTVALSTARSNGSKCC